MPAGGRSTGFFAAALAQHANQHATFACPQHQPACGGHVKRLRITLDLKNHSRKIAAFGRLIRRPQGILQGDRAHKNHPLGIDAVLAQSIGKRQTGINRCRRIDDPQNPACISLAELCSQSQRKPGSAGKITRKAASHFMQGIGPHAAIQVLVQIRDVK